MTKEPSWIAHAAQRAGAEPWTLGHLLSRYCDMEGTSDANLATELGCAPDTLRWLYLCRVPSPARFGEDVERIAQRFGLDVHRLAALVRRADALAALGAPGHDAGERELLMAARDREDGEDTR